VNGWSFADQNNAYARAWHGEPFRDSNHAEAKEIFEGIWQPTGHQFVAFDYSYTEKRTDAQGHTSSHTHHYEVRVLYLPRMLPSLSVSREGFGTKVAKFFGGQDIELESDDFNRAFRVTADDARYAYGVLHPQLMEWLLGPGIILTPWRTDRQCLITFEDGRLDPQRFPHRIGLMAMLASQIPQQVWNDFGR
jgi:hypothetical protein